MAIRVVATRGLQFLLPFWFSTEPMFWLPHGWFPYYAEWVLSLPRAPLGSVSIASWQVACSGVIALVGETAAAAVARVRGSEAGAGRGNGKEKKKAVPVDSTAAAAGESKKDL